MSELENPKHKAYTDVLAYWHDEITKEEFIASFKANTKMGNDYALTIRDLMLDGALTGIGVKEFAKECGISTHESCELLTYQDRYQQKLVSALFDVAYTRVPNNELSIDGKPISYTKNYNTDSAAVAALSYLERIQDDTKAMTYLRAEWSYPQKPEDYKVANEIIRASVHHDKEECFKKNDVYGKAVAKFRADRSNS